MQYPPIELTKDNLITLASWCGLEAEVNVNGFVTLVDNPAVEWNPAKKLSQNHKLLETVIAKGKCRLLHDEGIDEFFIYSFEYDGPPLAHRRELKETVIEAAVELWINKEE